MFTEELAYKLLTSNFNSDGLKFIEDVTYSNLRAHYYPTIMSSLPYNDINSKYAIIRIYEKDIAGNATNFKVEKILSTIEVNDILFNEYKTLVEKDYPQLILTGSLALHLYQPLQRPINNINVMIDETSLHLIKNNIIPLYDDFQNFDKRTWGMLPVKSPFKTDLYVLVKNELSYRIYQNVKVSDVDDILSAKMYRNCFEYNLINNKDIHNYMKFSKSLGKFYNEHTHKLIQYSYQDDECPF